MIDDMIDTGGTLKFAAAVLEREGADNCYMLASHGVFSKGSMEAVAGIKKDFLSAVVVTNSIPQEANKAAIAADFHVIDISGELKANPKFGLHNIADLFFRPDSRVCSSPPLPRERLCPQPVSADPR
jgi:hypoxanthine phosphoribosyltransferase